MLSRRVANTLLLSLLLSTGSAQLPQNPDWTEEAEEDTQLYGEQMSLRGDYNDDGYKDLAVGAPKDDSGLSDRGKAFLYLGSDTGLADTAVWTAHGVSDVDYFGGDLSYAGDVNNDGFDDLIVSAPDSDSGMTDRGSAFLFRGDPSGLEDTASSVFYGEQDHAYFGWSVSNAGDVNDDGFDDVIIGAYEQDSSYSDAGRAYLFRGSSSGLSDTAVWVEGVHEANAWFGASVSYAGDLNGDGFDDVVVGCPKKGNATDNFGRAYFYYGSASGLPDTSSYWLTPPIASDGQAGRIVTAAGDIDNDGIDDVVIGSDAGGAGGYYAAGEAWAFHGSPSGIQYVNPQKWNFYPDDNYMRFADDLVNAGDVNGDGYDDLLVGAPEHSSSKGKIYLFTGSDTGYAAQPTSTYEGDQIQSYFGTSVGAGDVTGNGDPDLSVGANRYNVGYPDGGKAFLFLGKCASKAATINASPSSPCMGDSVLLDAGSGYISYAWSTGDSSQTTGVELNDTSTYSIQTVGDSGCVTNSDTLLVPNPLPNPVFTGLDTSFCADDSVVQLNGDPSGGSFSGPGVSSGSFDPQAAGIGSHTLSYSYTDSNGCTGSVDTTVKVVDCATSLARSEGFSGLKLRPNPTKGWVVLEHSPRQELRITIRDLQGKRIDRYELSKHRSRARIDLRELSKGVYYIHVRSGKRKSVRKLIKR
ncbi:MAG: FG-GAP-like repeat-containing protein [Flavobacteriales bacterium]